MNIVWRYVHQGVLHRNMSYKQKFQMPLVVTKMIPNNGNLWKTVWHQIGTLQFEPHNFCSKRWWLYKNEGLMRKTGLLSLIKQESWLPARTAHNILLVRTVPLWRHNLPVFWSKLSFWFSLYSKSSSERNKLPSAIENSLLQKIAYTSMQVTHPNYTSCCSEVESLLRAKLTTWRIVTVSDTIIFPYPEAAFVCTICCAKLFA